MPIHETSPDPSITSTSAAFSALADAEGGIATAEPERLSRLWPAPATDERGVAKPDAEVGPWSQLSAAEMGEVFRHFLQTPVEAVLADSADGLIDSAATPPRSGHATTFAQLISSDAPSIDLLQRVKRFAKLAMGSDEGDLPREIAGVVYFGAIAVALVRARTRITSLSDRELRDALQWASRRSWLTESIKELFVLGLQRLEAGQD